MNHWLVGRNHFYCTSGFSMVCPIDSKGKCWQTNKKTGENVDEIDSPQGLIWMDVQWIEKLCDTKFIFQSFTSSTTMSNGGMAYSGCTHSSWWQWLSDLYFLSWLETSLSHSLLLLLWCHHVPPSCSFSFFSHHSLLAVGFFFFNLCVLSCCVEITIKQPDWRIDFD